MDEQVVIPEHPLLPEDERVELQELFARFTEALKSEDEDSMTRFFAEEQPFFDNASEMQNAIFMLTMQQLGLITEEEAAAALAGEDLDAVIYSEDYDESFDLSDDEPMSLGDASDAEVLADEYLLDDDDRL